MFAAVVATATVPAELSARVHAEPTRALSDASGIQRLALCGVGETLHERRDATWRTAEGFPTWSRNLKEGVFKGGREGKQLYLRFFTGLPGTPMPSGSLPGEQVWRVVQYVQSLSDPAAQEKSHAQ